MNVRGKMILTGRLILRKWTEEDAQHLFEAAQNPSIGKAAGWLQHTSVNYSRHIIKDYWNGAEDYAIVLKFTNQVVGGIFLKRKSESLLASSDDEAEIEFWLAEPYWEQGIMYETLSAFLKHCFADLKLMKVWGRYFDDNMRAWNLLKKCGFQYKFTRKNVQTPTEGIRRTEHIFCLTCVQWCHCRI